MWERKTMSYSMWLSCFQLRNDIKHPTKCIFIAVHATCYLTQRASSWNSFCVVCIQRTLSKSSSLYTFIDLGFVFEIFQMMWEGERANRFKRNPERNKFTEIIYCFKKMMIHLHLEIGLHANRTQNIIIEYCLKWDKP